MEEIVKEFNNLIRNQRAKDTTVKGLIILMTMMVFAFGFFLLAAFKHFDNSRYVIDRTTGEVKQLRHISKEEERLIQCKSHIALFVGYFYCFDQYNIEDQLNKAFWLSDESVKKLSDSYKEKDWYNKVIQLNIVQTCYIDDENIQVDITRYPYVAGFSATITLWQGTTFEKFGFNATCNLQGANQDFPKNPHGLIITNYQQSELLQKK